MNKGWTVARIVLFIPLIVWLAFVHEYQEYQRRKNRER